MTDDPANTAPSVLHNGIRVLRAFSVNDPALGVTEIARRVDLHKSTASRILAQLEQMDLVTRDVDSGRFRLGTGLIALAGPLLANLDVRRMAYPALEGLTERTSETSALVVWTGHESVSVEQVASPLHVKHTSPIGTRFGTAASSSVQVFLSAMSDAQVRELLGQRLLGGRGDDHEVRRLLDRLAKVRAEGIALNLGETSIEEIGISAPVRDHRGRTVAAILLSVPSFRVSEQLRHQLAEAVRTTAEDVSEQLGAVSVRRGPLESGSE